MCGIAGIIDKHQCSVNPDAIKSMCDAITHRGPDDKGFFATKNFAFGHRRLSIIDLSAEGHQPMHYRDRYTITYNGEIYNYLELKNELLKEGYQFHSKTDTEIILASYDKWGSECISRFNGMWAFALYDKEKNTIFCSRDRFGVKPFYYAHTENYFAFGSEIKQLLPFLSECTVNKKILMDYLVLSYEDHSDETFFENILKLPPAHNLIYHLDSGEFIVKEYYTITINTHLSHLLEDKATSLYLDSLQDAVKIRLRSDVKIGTCLSGGLDSSSIAAIASSLYNSSGNTLSAIHAKSTEPTTDESEWARKVADYCRLDLHVIEPTVNEFRDCIEKVISIQEEPFGSPSIIMQYLVFQKANQLGCKVMLDGQGGDETLLGYERYFPAYLLSLKGRNKISGLLLAFKNSKLSFFQLIQYFVYFTNTTIRVYRLKKKMHFIKQTYFNYLSTRIVQKSSASYHDILQLQLLEINTTQLPHLLKYEDKNSMYHSIEARLPFVDYRNIENALAIDNSFKIKEGWTKYILRKAVENLLPKDVVWRKNKMGFEAPVKSWFDALSPQMEHSVKNSAIINIVCNRFDFSSLDAKNKWKLFNIAEWERIYNVKIK